MDQVSKIRAKNMLDSLLAYCEDVETEEEKAVLLRICLVAVNKIRMHANVDPMLGYGVRELNKRASSCDSTDSFLELWAEGIELVCDFKNALTSRSLIEQDIQ